MKLFLDSANIDEIKQVRFLIDGVTTNPTLMTKEGKEPTQHLKNIIEQTSGIEVHVEPVSDVYTEVKFLYGLSPHIVAKIPITPHGIGQINTLHNHNLIRTNATLCFSPAQAILAAKSGADYVSIFVGRLDDAKENGIQVIRDTKQIFKNYGFKTQIIAASIRNQRHVIESAMAGADVITVPYKVMMKMFEHPLTFAGIKQFDEDYKKCTT